MYASQPHATTAAKPNTSKPRSSSSGRQASTSPSGAANKDPTGYELREKRSLAVGDEFAKRQRELLVSHTDARVAALQKML